MHPTALVSFLLALPCGRAVVVNPPEPCLGGVNVEVGQKCLMESYEFCDADCTKRVKMGLENSLNPTVPKYELVLLTG